MIAKKPSKVILERILNMIFGNSAIQSNRIESFNNQIKVVLPERGIQNERHVMNQLVWFVQINNVNLMVPSSEMTLPVSARMSFNNLSQFFTQNIY